MEIVLQHYGINWLQKKGKSLIGRCPIHGGDNPRAFQVSLSKNAWNCFTGCGRGGNVIDFVAAMEGFPSDVSGFRHAALMLQEWFLPVLIRDKHCNRESCIQRKPPGVITECCVNPPLSFTLANLRTCHPYLQMREINASTAKLFGIGFYPGCGIMSGRIVIPIYDYLGRLMAYAGRAATDRQASLQGKYRFPARFRKSLVVFNLHRVIHEGNHELIVVEGFFDVIRLHQLGYKNSIALMGTSMSLAQEHLILDHARSVILMFDGDPAGRSCTLRIKQQLAGKLSVRTIILPDGIQPEHLTPSMLQEMRLR